MNWLNNSDSIAGIDARKRFERDSINAQAQVSALNDAVDELKKQYILENTPFLSIVRVRTNFKVGKKVTLNLVFENLAKNPVYIKQYNVGFLITKKDKTPSDFYKMMEKNFGPTFLQSPQYPLFDESLAIALILKHSSCTVAINVQQVMTRD